MKHRCKCPCRTRKRAWAEAHAVVACVTVLCIPWRLGVLEVPCSQSLSSEFYYVRLNFLVYFYIHVYSIDKTVSYYHILIVVSCDHKMFMAGFQQRHIIRRHNSNISLITSQIYSRQMLTFPPPINAQAAQFKHWHQDLVLFDNR